MEKETAVHQFLLLLSLSQLSLFFLNTIYINSKFALFLFTIVNNNKRKMYKNSKKKLVSVPSKKVMDNV